MPPRGGEGGREGNARGLIEGGDVPVGYLVSVGPGHPVCLVPLRSVGNLSFRLVSVEAVRHFADVLGGVSANPVVYAELPGAQHAFDLFRSLRYEMVVDAVEASTAWVRSRQPRDLRLWVERAKGIEPSPRAWEARVLPLNYARRRGDSSRAV
jgi:hypothetical protein